MRLFTELLQIALGNRTELSSVPSSTEWERLYNEARRQAVVGSTPGHRQGGDIDMWVGGDRKAMMEWLLSQYEVNHVVWHHVDAKIIEDKAYNPEGTEEML